MPLHIARSKPRSDLKIAKTKVQNIVPCIKSGQQIGNKNSYKLQRKTRQQIENHNQKLSKNELKCFLKKEEVKTKKSKNEEDKIRLSKGKRIIRIEKVKKYKYKASYPTTKLKIAQSKKLARSIKADLVTHLYLHCLSTYNMPTASEANINKRGR